MRRATGIERWPRPAVMGVVNVTPDSFSDGGRLGSPREAADVARAMLADGAALVDVGGESTRPGSGPVTPDEELRRVVPVLELLAGEPVSVDTSRAVVAREALALGAAMINDVTALRRDPDLAAAVAATDAHLCLMHMQGEPRTMQVAPHYVDVVSEVAAFLEERLAFAVAAGIPEERVCLDPGIGFGKTPDQNLELVRRLDRIVAIGRPVLLGLSRKATLARVLDGPEARVGTDAASVGAAVAAFDRGATLFRVHDVRSHVEALAAAAAVERGTVRAWRTSFGRSSSSASTACSSTSAATGSGSSSTSSSTTRTRRPRRATGSRRRSTIARWSPRSSRCRTVAHTTCSRHSRAHWRASSRLGSRSSAHACACGSRTSSS